MSGIVLLLMIGVAVGVGVLVLVNVQGGVGQGQDLETENWTRVNAEVVSVLRTSTSTFLLVRYVVGTSLIRADVRYPLPGPVPCAGRRVPIRFDPVSPAKAICDLQKVAGPA